MMINIAVGHTPTHTHKLVVIRWPEVTQQNPPVEVRFAEAESLRWSPTNTVLPLVAQRQWAAAGGGETGNLNLTQEALKATKKQTAELWHSPLPSLKDYLRRH